MGALLLLHPNRADAATLTGGDWAEALPLANLQHRRLAKVARSASLDLEDTQFQIAFTAAEIVRALVLVNHNLSVGASWRVTAAEDSGFEDVVYASGWLPVWPAVYDSESLEWEDDNWWTGTFTQADLAGIVWSTPLILPGLVTAGYWLVEIDDALNPAGYVQIGRLFMARDWQPSSGYSWGAQLGVETDTAVERALSGAEFFDRRDPYRVYRFALDHLPDSEALQRGFELMRRAGIDQEIFLVGDDADPINQLRRCFLARLRQLSPLEAAYTGHSALPWELKEILS